MKLAFLYAGQGSQHPGMGRDLYGRYGAFRTVLDKAPVDFDLKALCFEGPAETLRQTRYTQPCMVAFAGGMTNVLQSMGIRPDYAAGLSLGEYAALAASGVWDWATAISLAAFRGQVMEDAAKDCDSAMIAVLGLERRLLEQAVQESRHLGTVVIANYNCPGQLVLGGEREAVQEAAARAKALGARRCMPLRVSGPFHTPLMAPAGKALEARFRDLPFAEPQFPVLFNCLGREKSPNQSIADLLVRQVQSSVYMEDTICRLREIGVDAIIEIGPGNVLAGFVGRTLSGMPVYSVETVAQVEELPQWLKERA